MKNSLWIVGSVSVVLLAGCTWNKERLLTAVGKSSARDTIQLTVDTVNVKVDIHDPGAAACGQQNRSPGCVKVAKNRIIDVPYKLRPPDDANYYIDQFEVCIVRDPDEPVEKPIGDQLECSLDIWDRLEFVAEAGGELRLPSGNGVIDLSDLKPTSIRIYSPNTFRQLYFYTIKVCANLGTPCFFTDPEWENDGRGIGSVY